MTIFILKLSIYEYSIRIRFLASIRIEVVSSSDIR